jgi:hypothetical protein
LNTPPARLVVGGLMAAAADTGIEGWQTSRAVVADASTRQLAIAMPRVAAAQRDSATPGP